MPNHHITTTPSQQTKDPCGSIPVDLHAERIVLGAALRVGSSAALGDLDLAHFFDPWHELIADAIVRFPQRRFGIPELAATLPAFLRPYLEALLQYRISAVFRERSSN
jgi:hypothetical protein